MVSSESEEISGDGRNVVDAGSAADESDDGQDDGDPAIGHRMSQDVDGRVGRRVV